MTEQLLQSYGCKPIEPDSVVAALGELGPWSAGRAQRFRSTYYDTFDWRLFEAGRSLAERRSARGPEIVLLNNGSQSPAASAAGKLPGGFAADLPAGKLHNALDAIIDVRRLLPKLRIASTVLPMELRDGEGKAVLRARLEQHTCHGLNSDTQVPLGTQVVLEPVRGYSKPLHKAREILDALFEDGGNNDPLVAKGLRALGQRPGDYSSKLRLALNPEMCAGQAAREIHLKLLETMERNEDGMASNLDSEFLHDFRVAVRRTRSALSLLDKGVLPREVVARAKADFRWLGKRTNRMRDLDVYLIAFPGYRAGLMEEYRAALDPLHDHLIAESRRESRRIAKLVQSARYRELRDRWRTYLADTEPTHADGPKALLPVTELASHRIRKIYRRLIKEGGAITDESPNALLHEVRITGKKLRYLLEFFQSLYPRDEIAALIGPLKRLQNVLGDFQDAEIQSHAIRDFAREMVASGSVSVETQMAMGMVADSILRRQAAARSAFHGRFVHFAGPHLRDSFARLFGS